MSDTIDFNLTYLQHFFRHHGLETMENAVLAACREKRDRPHGDVARWCAAMADLPDISDAELTVTDATIALTGHSQAEQATIEATLKRFCPWRKGPFRFLTTTIDTEWDSLLKWQRILASLKAAGIELSGKNVLDIGCGNGVFLWLMHKQGAKSVTGVDPMWLFYHQFMVFQRYLNNRHLAFLPLGVQDLPLTNAYDCVFSMGVLYHRRSPLDHLAQLKGMLKKGGELILETIVLADAGKQLLTPENRYAGMRNVWMISSVAVLTDWLKKMNFNVVHVGKLAKTTVDEQRQTPWMNFHSLNQFLDADDDERTVEGHPAPYRVIVVATST